MFDLFWCRHCIYSRCLSVYNDTMPAKTNPKTATRKPPSGRAVPVSAGRKKRETWTEGETDTFIDQCVIHKVMLLFVFSFIVINEPFHPRMLFLGLSVQLSRRNLASSHGLTSLPTPLTTHPTSCRDTQTAQRN